MQISQKPLDTLYTLCYTLGVRDCPPPPETGYNKEWNRYRKKLIKKDYDTDFHHENNIKNQLVIKSIPGHKNFKVLRDYTEVKVIPMSPYDHKVYEAKHKNKLKREWDLLKRIKKRRKGK